MQARADLDRKLGQDMARTDVHSGFVILVPFRHRAPPLEHK